MKCRVCDQDVRAHHAGGKVLVLVNAMPTYFIYQDTIQRGFQLHDETCKGWKSGEYHDRHNDWLKESEEFPNARITVGEDTSIFYDIKKEAKDSDAEEGFVDQPKIHNALYTSVIRYASHFPHGYVDRFVRDAGTVDQYFYTIKYRGELPEDLCKEDNLNEDLYNYLEAEFKTAHTDKLEIYNVKHNSECYEINYHLRLSILFDEFPPEDNYPKIGRGKGDSVRFFTTDEKHQEGLSIVGEIGNDISSEYLEDANDAPTESAVEDRSNEPFKLFEFYHTVCHLGEVKSTFSVFLSRTITEAMNYLSKEHPSIIGGEWKRISIDGSSKEGFGIYYFDTEKHQTRVCYLWDTSILDLNERLQAQLNNMAEENNGDRNIIEIPNKMVQRGMEISDNDFIIPYKYYTFTIGDVGREFCDDAPDGSFLSISSEKAKKYILQHFPSFCDGEWKEFHYISYFEKRGKANESLRLYEYNIGELDDTMKMYSDDAIKDENLLDRLVPNNIPIRFSKRRGDSPEHWDPTEAYRYFAFDIRDNKGDLLLNSWDNPRFLARSTNDARRFAMETSREFIVFPMDGWELVEDSYISELTNGSTGNKMRLFEFVIRGLDEHSRAKIYSVLDSGISDAIIDLSNDINFSNWEYTEDQEVIGDKWELNEEYRLYRFKIEDHTGIVNGLSKEPFLATSIMISKAHLMEEFEAFRGSEWVESDFAHYKTLEGSTQRSITINEFKIENMNPKDRAKAFNAINLYGGQTIIQLEGLVGQ